MVAQYFIMEILDSWLLLEEQMEVMGFPLGLPVAFGKPLGTEGTEGLNYKDVFASKGMETAVW